MQTGPGRFYPISPDLYGADVAKVFAGAPLPIQSFFIHPDQAFHECGWWVLHKKAYNHTLWSFHVGSNSYASARPPGNSTSI